MHRTPGLFALMLWIVLLLLAPIGLRAADPVKVFILAGQSNMEGKGKVSLLEHQISQPETRALFEHLQKDGKWVERADVSIRFLDRQGPLTVGYGSPGCIGPELEFGWVVGDHHEAPVLIIKTAWGGKSLARDFRPPSSGVPEDATLQPLLESARKRDPETTIGDVRRSFGHYYRTMIREVDRALASLPELIPDYSGQGYELAGMVWFQGWNDMISDEYTAEYAENLANLIRDVRADLHAPDLPFVIGQLGVDGPDLPERPTDEKKKRFKEAQAAPASLPEFRGNVALVRTDQYWDIEADAVFRKGWKENLVEWEKIGSDFPYHYLGSVKCYGRIGKAFGMALIELDRGVGQ